jgi:hypothetical protein
MRNDDIRELQKKVLELASEVGPKTRHRLLEIHARLQQIAEDREAAESATGGGKRGREAA